MKTAARFRICRKRAYRAKSRSLRVVQQDRQCPRCSLFAEAQLLWREHYHLGPDATPPAQGICARREKLTPDERCTLARSAIANVQVEILVDRGLTPAEARRIVAQAPKHVSVLMAASLQPRRPGPAEK